MMTRKMFSLALLAPLAMAACTSTAYDGTPRLMARGTDSAVNNVGTLTDKQAALAVLPDGCEAWIIDDGAEGYSGTRSDTKSGLPVCTDEIPAGSVIGNPQTTAFPDYLP